MSCLWTKTLLQKHHVALYWPQLHLPTLPCNGKDQRAAGKQHTQLAQHQSGCPNRLFQGQVFHSFSVALHQCSQPVSHSKPVTLCCMTLKAWQSMSLGPHHQNLNMVFYFIVICRAIFFSQRYSQRANTHLCFNHCIWRCRAPSNDAQSILHR